MTKEFKASDIERGGSLPRIVTKSFREELIYNPPDWMRRGLQESATGYGRKLNSGYSIRFEGRLLRIYVTQIANAGSAWFKVKGETIYVD